MAEITAAKCQLVRDRTDCTMMAAKDALKETDGDVPYAVIWIKDQSSHERLRKLFSIGRKPRIKMVDGQWVYDLNNCTNGHWKSKVKDFVYDLNTRPNQFHAFYYVQGDSSAV